MPDVRFASRPFEEQQRYFRRKVNVPSARWDDLWQAEHAHGFMVAGVTRAAVLEDLRTAIQRALDQGEGFEAFKARFGEILARNGWIGGAGGETEAGRLWRMRVIYQTNLRTSYMAGRWEQLQEFPYLRYQHNTLRNPRETHQGWDGLVLRRDDPWWDTHYPPNGWGCGCTVTGVGEGRMRALGKRGPDPTPGPGDGDPPPEWAYHVGKAAQSLPAAASLGEKVMAMPEAWRRAALDDAQKRSVQWLKDWPGFVKRMEAEIRSGAPRPQGAATPVGFLPAPAVDALARGPQKGDKKYPSVPVRSALTAISDRIVMHILRDLKVIDRPELAAELMQAALNLPEELQQATAVVWDGDALQFAVRREGGGYRVTVVRANFKNQKAQDSVTANWVRTVELRSLQDLRRFPLVSGELP